MKKHVYCLLLSSLCWIGSLPAAVGQVGDRLLYGGVSLIKGVGKNNSLMYGSSVSLRYQYPLLPKVALTAKVGLDVYQVNLLYIGISGYYNTVAYYMNIGGSYGTPLYVPVYTPTITAGGAEYQATGVSIPFSFGPRVYVTDKVHVDLNVGVDIAVNENTMSLLHVEPGVGYTMPLSSGRFLDLNASFFTSFGKGSGAFTISAAYPLKIHR